MPYRVGDFVNGETKRRSEASVGLTARTYFIDLARPKGEPKESTHTEILRKGIPGLDVSVAADAPLCVKISLPENRSALILKE
jgi:hypothetical protein